MEIAIVAEIPEHQPTATFARPGSTIRQTLLGDEACDGLKFRFVRNQEGNGGEAFETPRHHHGFQQIRWSESGSVNYAPNQNIQQGDIAYFPRGAYYGPQVKDEGVQLLLQFGFGDEFPAGGKDWYRTIQQGMDVLSKRGRFENGMYIDTDPETGQERQRDAVEALFEERTKKKVVVPPEGYDRPVLMHPKAYSFYRAADGVEVKHLGSFYDHSGPNANVRISVVRLNEGGAYELGPERAQIIWSSSPGMIICERTYPELTCIYSPRNESAKIAGVNNVEAFVVEFPRLD